jgi:hypothetical protein
MSPEQVRGASGEVGPAADVWALGVILYELLTRRRPFEGPGEAAIIQQICAADPIPPRSLRTGLPRGLETVCLKCLEERPGDRYRSPSELANDLQRVLDRVDPLGRRPPLPKRVGRRVKRHPVASAFAGLAALTVALSAEYLDHRSRSDADIRSRRNGLLIDRIAASPPARWEEIVPQLPAGDGAVADELKRRFVNGGDDPRLGFALALATGHREYADYGYDRLLSDRPENIGPVARLLEPAMPDLRRRLEVAAAGPGRGEANDRRRANAACALAVLGPDGPALGLLRSGPDPQARTFVVHAMGPAGVAPARLFGRLKDPGTPESVRIALIQGLGSVPDPAWAADVRAEVARWLIGRYRKDPSAGIHGSAKWLLRRWGLAADLERIDRDLAGKAPPDPGFRWRISGRGLTMITVDDPGLDRILEVSDTEITVAMYRSFNESRPPGERSYSSPEASPDESCPVNGVSYFDAAAFCNWLGGREGLPPDAACYRATGWHEDAGDRTRRQAVHEPMLDRYEGGGYRLPTSREFDVLCRAGTRTRRYQGDSNELFDRYAWTLSNSKGVTHPVAGLIPNDFGLFDTLGNIWEWCDSEEPHGLHGGVVGDLQGGYSSFGQPDSLDRSTGIPRVVGYHRTPEHGFRVVRTRRVP